MMIRAFLLFFLAWASVASGQSTLERRAEHYMGLMQFAEAYPLWDHLARRAEDRGGEPAHFAEMAVVSAQRAGLREEALTWSKVVVKRGDASWEELIRHVNLLRINRREGQIQRLFDSSALRHLSPDSIELLRAAIDGGIPQDTLKLIAERYRPRASTHEYAATTYRGGVVFQITADDKRIGAGQDAWSGVPFTELAYLRNASYPHPPRGGSGDLQGAEPFPFFGHSRTHDGPVSFNASGTWALLTTNAASGASRSTIDRLHIARYELVQNSWRPAEPLPFNSPDYSCLHAVFDPDTNIVFASDMPGGAGGMDLYISRWQDSLWQQPEPLVPNVNTAGNEVFPYVSSNGTIYFASDGRAGAGGLDVFQLLADGSLAQLGHPINSYADDFAFYFEEETQSGWLSSNRGTGVDAIYRVEELPAEVPCAIRVLACDGNPLAQIPVRVVHSGRYPMDLTLETNNFGEAQFMGWPREKYVVEVLERPGSKLLPRDSLVLAKPAGEVTLTVPYSSIENQLVVVDENGAPAAGVLLDFTNAKGNSLKEVTDEQGQFTWSTADASEELLAVVASLINYEDAAVEAPNSGDACQFEWRDTLVLQPVGANIDRIDLESIMYASGEFTLTEESRTELDKLVAYLSDRPNIRVELSSHTDCRDDEGRNLDLSQARADECVRYIISKGIDERRILAIGYGETKLLNHCSDASACGCAPPAQSDCVPCTEAMHQENRRTELRLLAD